MAGRAGLRNEGALYEAISRGNKDTFFFAKNPDTTVNVFENRYDRIPPTVQELRRIPPLNGAEFGRSCEFEFEVAGDMFVSPTVLIDLPSWLPPPTAALNRSTLITGSSLDSDIAGLSIGYTNGVGYFMFKKIQIFQDKLLLQEFSGDALFAARASRGSLGSAYMENSLLGMHDGSAAAIGFNATPPRIRLELPFIGAAEGFPSIAMRQQPFKLRLELRPLEEIVESSNAGASVAPVPWGKHVYVGATPPYTIPTLSRTAITSPTLQLETRHIYTDGQSQLALRSTTLEIPFQRLYENTFTFGPFDYASTAPLVKKRLDAQHPAGRLLWFMRTYNDIRAGRRWKIFADISGGEYYTAQTLLIAGRDRETAFSPDIWNTLTHYAKEDRDPGIGLGEMSWDLGDLQGRQTPWNRQPEGTINFSTADRPTFYTALSTGLPNDLYLKAPSVEMTAIIDAWVLYTISRDRGVLKYGN
jgi:hypothetical protein